MANILLILGRETSEFARGEFNNGLFQTAIETLEAMGHAVNTTIVEDGYDPADEIAKFKSADAVIYQYPVYWFMMPSSLKAYIDRVYAYGEFFGHGDGEYGTGGLMHGKKVMLSTTWNAPAEAFNGGSAFLANIAPEDVLLPMRKTHEFCGFDELSHFSSHNVIHSPQFESDRARYITHLKTVFADL